MSISMSMSMFYMSCPYVPYLTLPYLGYCNCYRMLGYGTGTGTGTVREGKGREGIRDTFFNTYLHT